MKKRTVRRTDSHQALRPSVRPALSGRLRRRTLLLFAVLLSLAGFLLLRRDILGAFPNSQARNSLDRRQPEKAEKWLRLSERLAPGNAEKEFLLARLRRREGDFDAMRAGLEKARRAGWPAEAIERENWLALVQSGKMREAEAHLGELFTDPRGDAGEISEAYVIGYLRNYRIKEAIELLALWEADFPDDPQPFFWRGQIREEQRAWAEAAHEFQQALARNPEHRKAALELASVLLEMKRPEDALRYYDAASEMGAEAALTRIGRARCLKLLGREEEARRVLRETLQTDGDHVQAAVELAQLESAAGRHEQALEMLAPLAPQEPHNLDLQYAYALALRGTGRLEEAQVRLEAVSEIRRNRHRASALVAESTKQPSNPDLRCEIGSIYLHNGDEATGLIWLESALECNPLHRETHRVLADYYAAHSAGNAEYQALAQNHRQLAGN